MIHASLERHGEINREIVAMVNDHSPLTRKLRLQDVANANYCVVERDGMVVGCVKISKVSWYQVELMHLVVLPAYREQGIGRELVALALKEAADLEARVVQCTIRTNNAVSLALFASEGFTSPFQFLGLSGNTVSLWQKVL